MIQLDDNYRIESEPACWTLNYKKATGKHSPTSGEPTYSCETSYHANLKQALAKYLDESLKGSDSLQQVLNRISEVEATIEKVRI